MFCFPATRALQECFRIGELWKSPRLLAPAYGLSALVMQARGQAEKANAMIHRAEQATRDSYTTPYDIGLLALYQIALRTAQNDFQAIARWEQDHDSEWRSRTGRARDALTIVLARAQIARFHRTRESSATSQARELIEPALEQTQASGLTFHGVRLLILKALALHAQGETSSAITTLKRAVALAEPENYVRSFLDFGKPMQELLSWSLEGKALDEPHQRAFVSKLLPQFDTNVSVEIKPLWYLEILLILSLLTLPLFRWLARPSMSGRIRTAASFLARADRELLGRLITRRVAPHDFEQALERRPEDIKVVLQFSDI